MKYTDDIIRKIVEDDTNNEYELIKIFKKGSSRFIRVKHIFCSKIYETNIYDFIKGCRCKECSSRKGALKRTDTIENFKNYVSVTTNKEYECLSDLYINVDSKIKIKHNLCGNVYEVSPYCFKQKWHRCPRCSSLMMVSYTHAILALLYEKYYNEVYFEYDAGFRTNKKAVSRYDLYVKDLNLLIEFQSEYHDDDAQKIIDKDKKEYAINNGYNYLDFDYRDKTILEYVKMLFPWLNEIPQDLDLTKFYKADVSTMQILLNDGLSIKEVANKMNIKESLIRNNLFRGSIKYPEFYKEKFKQNIKVVQLSLDGEYINTYESATRAKKETSISTILLAINKKQNCAGGYFWVKHDDYINKNYELPNKDDCMIVNNETILQYDKKGNLVKKYNRIIDVKKTKINVTNVYCALNRDSHYSMGYFWIKEKDLSLINVDDLIVKYKIYCRNKIVQLTLNYDLVKIWDNLKTIKKEFSNTINLHRALTENKTAGGYRWMYEEDCKNYINTI